MPGPCMQLLSGASHFSNPTNKRNRINSSSTRKIRVICYDPDATDSSSDDEESSGRKTRIVQEISLPNSSISSSPAVTEVSFQDSNISANKNKASLWESSGSKYRGVRPRKWGKKIEFDALVKSSSEDSESVLSLSSPASASTSEMNGSHEKGSEKVEVQMLDFASIEEQFQMELDSLFVNDYGEVFNDLPISEFHALDRSIDLPGFDFELGKDELAWIDDPLNIACCP